MWWTLLFLFFVIVFMIGIVSCIANKQWCAVAYTLLALVALSTTVFFVAPFELGYSRVPRVPESFKKRLEVEVIYQVVAIATIGHEDKILLVKKDLSDDYRTIRVKNTPPQRFTLINGFPVEVK